MPLLALGLYNFGFLGWQAKYVLIMRHCFSLFGVNFVQNCYVMCLYMAGGITRIMFCYKTNGPITGIS